jgi:hypothetical protein
MKVDLSNHQSVCLCPPLITLNRLVDFHEIWHGCDTIQGGLDAVIFNPIPLTVLQLLLFKFDR